MSGRANEGPYCTTCVNGNNYGGDDDEDRIRVMCQVGGKLFLRGLASEFLTIVGHTYGQVLASSDSPWLCK